MIAPSKFTSIENSVLKKAIGLLQTEKATTTIALLYEEKANQFDSIDEFMLSVETLWLLGKISVDLNSGVITYAS